MAKSKQTSNVITAGTGKSDKIAAATAALKAIIEKDEKLRMDIAKSYEDNGQIDRVFISAQTGQLFGLGDAESKNWTMAQWVASKKKDSIRWTISQILRLKDDDEYSETFGSERLVIQLLMHYKDHHNNQLSATYSCGRTSQPIFKTNTTAFNSETGEPTESRTTLEGFKEVLSIPFSEDLIRTLAPIFSAKVSLIVNTGVRKYSLNTIDEFVRPFDELKAAVTPKKTMQDGSQRAI